MKQGVILIGEPMGLLIAQEEGPLDSVSGFSLAVAGAEFNVAVGLSRLGNKAAYMTKLGHDPFGQAIPVSFSSGRALPLPHYRWRMWSVSPLTTTAFSI